MRVGHETPGFKAWKFARVAPQDAAKDVQVSPLLAVVEKLQTTAAEIS